MKHAKNATTALLSAAICSLTLSGCGGSAPKVTYENAGYYTIYSLETEDDSFKRKDLKEDGRDAMYLWLDEDGEGELFTIDETYDLEWQDGKILDVDGEEASYELDGNKLSFEVELDGEEYAFVFKFKDEDKPKDAGKVDTASDDEEDGDTADTKKEDEKDEEKEKEETHTVVVGSAPADYIGTGSDIADYHVEITGAQAVTDADGRDAVRLFIDFTNNSEESVSFYSVLHPSLSQGGVRLNSTYVKYNSDDTAEEDDNWMRDIRPGVTLRCSEVFTYNAQGGDIEVEIYNGYGSDKHSYEFTMNPASFSSERPGELAIETIANPGWTKGLPKEAGLEGDDVKYIITLTKTEDAASYQGDKLVRVYYKVENKNDEQLSSYRLGCDIRAFQDGVELSYGSAKERVNEERNYGMDIDAGKTMEFAECFELISDSPVEIEVTTYSLGPVAGMTYNP